MHNWSQWENRNLSRHLICNVLSALQGELNSYEIGQQIEYNFPLLNIYEYILSKSWRRKGVCLMFEASLILQKIERQRGKKEEKKPHKLNMPFSPQYDFSWGERKTRSLAFWMYWQVFVRLHIHLLNHTWILQCTIHLANNAFKVHGPLKLLYMILSEKLKCFTSSKNT